MVRKNGISKLMGICKQLFPHKQKRISRRKGNRVVMTFQKARFVGQLEFRLVLFVSLLSYKIWNKNNWTCRFIRSDGREVWAWYGNQVVAGLFFQRAEKRLILILWPAQKRSTWNLNTGWKILNMHKRRVRQLLKPRSKKLRHRFA